MNLTQDVAKHVYEIYGQLVQNYSTQRYWDTHRSLETEIRLYAPDQEAADTTINMLAETVNTPAFLFDMWSEDPIRTHQEILSAIHTTAQRLGEYIKAQRNQGDLPAIVAGQKDFGIIFIPTELLRQLWQLGQSVIELQAKVPGAGDKVEACAIEVLQQSSAWVQHVNRRWGNSPDSQLTPVMPISDSPF